MNKTAPHIEPAKLVLSLYFQAEYARKGVPNAKSTQSEIVNKFISITS
jgi:hypothetical protein